MKKKMYNITEWSSDNAYTGWFSLEEILSNTDISNGSTNEEDWHCEIHEVKEVDVDETFEKILLKHCSENKVHLTSNEIETIKVAAEEYRTNIDWKLIEKELKHLIQNWGVPENDYRGYPDADDIVRTVKYIIEHK